MSNRNEVCDPLTGCMERIPECIQNMPTPIQKVKALRTLQQALNDVAKSLCGDPEMKPAIRELSLVRTAGQQARHWGGEALAILGEAYPYPNGADPATDKVDPRADVAQEGGVR